jgi:hypothetical protein
MPVAVSQAPDWDQWADQVIDEFPLEKLLGKGAKSAVFRTRFNDGPAAIKLLPAALPQSKVLTDRWTRAMELDYPDLLKIFKAGTFTKGDTTLAYVVMELADENLAEVLSGRKLTADETFEMLPHVADALTPLHRQGFAHGRLKASNVFAVNDTLKLSSDSVSAGSASEDLRALASLTVHALTQRPGTDPTVIAQLPRSFAEIVKVCAGQSGHAQWPAAELADRIRSKRPLAPSPSDPAPTLSPILQRWRLRPTQLAVGLGALLLVVLAVGSLLNSKTADSAAAAPVKSEPVAAVPTPAPAPVSKAPAAKPRAVKAEKPAEPVVQKPAPVKEAAPNQPSVSSGQVGIQVLPEITDKARKTVHGTVVIRVRVSIDPSGNVTDATLLPTGSHYLGKLSADASRKWHFAPSENGAAREATLRYEITNRDTKVAVSN